MVSGSSKYVPQKYAGVVFGTFCHQKVQSNIEQRPKARTQQETVNQNQEVPV